MTSEERAACGQRLEALVPVLQKYHPPEWVDFRGPMVPGWCEGLYVRSESDPIQFKAMFGSMGAARLAAYQISIVTKDIGPSIKPPDSPNGYWEINFEVPEAEVCW